MARKTERVEIDPNTYLVSDKYGNFFCGLDKGELFWSDQISLARESTEPQHFASICRWESHRSPKQEFVYK